MDRAVVDAIAKWPNVPACIGWLLLDRRGQWRMRDEACQAAGKSGDPIRHAALNAFIARNYERDGEGRWFFQNGPQRVFVDLAYTPKVVRLHLTPELALIDQCAQPLLPERCWTDDAGNVLFADANDAVALLHDHDLALFADLARFHEPDMSNAADIKNVSHADAGILDALDALDAADAADAADAKSASVSTAIGIVTWADGRDMPIHTIASADVPERFGFVQRPRL